MKKKRRKRGLSSFADEFALSLIFEATGGKVGKIRKSGEETAETENPVSFRDRAKLLDSITKLLAAQDAPDEEEESGVDYFRERLKPDERSGEDSSGPDSPEDDETGVRTGRITDEDGSPVDEV